MNPCPSPDDWFALGSDPALDAHLDRCAECRRVAAMLGRAGVLGDAPTESRDRVGLVPELVAPGEKLGRFVVQGPIGSGGMGIVLQALDPKLERTVALKVVRRMRDDAGWERARDRVLAEAKAMARLSHPNVVAIHDLIELDDERLIAMEFVAGPDLERWLQAKPPERDRIRVVRGLAEGIAAAHEAGVVHRDIKPSNVLIGQGIARITDFGLADLAGAQSPGQGGTHGYVAPELAGGAAADARSDQYAFAVTAWRTLFDTWPRDGARKGPLARVLERALAADPAARYASMRDVANALDRATTAPRRRRIAWISALAAAAAAGATVLALVREPASCALDTAIDGAWSPARRAGWIAVMQPIAGDATARLAADIDGAWQAWQRAATSACERPTTGTVACLRSLRRKLAGVIEHAREAGDASKIDDTLAFVRATDCLAAPPPTPLVLAPAARVVHEFIVAQLDDVTALTWLGQYRTAIARLEDLARRVPEGDAALHGELLYRRADLLARIGDTAGSIPVLQQALAIAERAGNPIARVNTMILLLVAYDELGLVNEAVALATIAEAAALAVPFDAARAARLANALASVAYTSGRFADAERKWREVVDLSEKRFPDGNDPELAGALHNLGMAVHAQGRIDDAIALQRRALAIFEATLGDDHPNTVMPVNQLASLELERGNLDESARHHERTLAVWEKTLGADHPHLSEPLIGLGRVEQDRGNVDAALALYRRGRSAALGLGTEHPLVALAEYRLAKLLRARGERREAGELIEHSVAAWDRSGAAVPDAHLSRFLLAQHRWDAGRRADARQLAIAARAALAKLDARYASAVEEIDRWLSLHR